MTKELSHTWIASVSLPLQRGMTSTDALASSSGLAIKDFGNP
jgi:hypothetical protein